MSGKVALLAVAAQLMLSCATVDPEPEPEPPINLQLRFSGGIGSGGTYDYNQANFNSTSGYWGVLDGTDGTIYLIDASNPDAPSTLGSVLPSATLKNLVFSDDGSRLYGFDFDSNLYIINVSNPAAPVEVGFVATPATGEIDGGWHWPLISGGHLFYNGHYPGGSGAGSVLIYSLSNPDSPSLVARWRHSGGSWGGGCCAVNGNRLYLTDYFARESLGGSPLMRVVDISTIASPSLLNTVVLPNPEAIGNLNGWNLRYISGELYMCDAIYIQRFSLADPDLPVFEDHVVAPSDTEGLAVGSGHIFWGASFDTSVDAYKVNGGSLPTLAQSLESSGAVSHFWDADTSNRVIVGFINGEMAIWSY